MIAVVQRVSSAHVTVDKEVTGRVGLGFMVLLGVRKGDDPEDGSILAKKVAELRVFEDDTGRMNQSLVDVGGGALVVSQFTLCADLRKGRRPGFEPAEKPDRARRLLQLFVDDLRDNGVSVEEGRFGATMDVSLVNHGPATFLLDSSTWRKRVDSPS